MNRGELRFLRELESQLQDGDDHDPLRSVQDRIRILEDIATSLTAPSSEDTDAPSTVAHAEPYFLTQKQTESAAAVRAAESIVWGRNSGSCFPHRRCQCPSHRNYSEISSINCDPAWPGLRLMPVEIDPTMLPTPSEARKIIQFHIEHLLWHHNVIHSTTFLEQCELFWSSGTANHPLWGALYLAIMSVRRQ